MQQRILQEFFEEDGRDLGQHRLLEFLREVPAKAKRQLNFNRFDLLIDRENEVVLIEDVLDASPVGACRVPLSEFITAVEAMSQNA